MMRTFGKFTACGVAVLVCICFVSAADLPLHGPNLLENGSFEGLSPGSLPPSDLPAGWFREAYGSDGQLSIVADGAPGCGHQSIQMRSRVDDSTGLHSALIEIAPTKAYLQRGWIKVVRGEKGSGLHLGRAWYAADESPVTTEDRGKNYNYIVTHAEAADWKRYKQVLIPDPTPEDGSYSSNEIPPDAHYLRIWTLAYRWDGTGRFDGLGLYEIDYDEWARQQINAKIQKSDIGRSVEDIKDQLAKIPAEAELASKASELVSEFSKLQNDVSSEKSRPVSEWIEDKERVDGLIEELKRMRWQVKLAVLLESVPLADE